MKKIDLGQTIAILANLGVIAGIVFLAVELRQNSDQLAAQSRAARLAVFTDFLNSQFQDPQLAELIVRARSGEPLTEAELYRIQAFNGRQWIAMQYVYGEVQRGMIDEAEISIEAWREAFLESPRARESWDETKHQLSPDFREFMERNVVNGE